MPTLQLWQKYDRETVHDIFDPETAFTPQTGKWGLPGIVKLDNPGDFVFFVTFGTRQGDHDFDEEITQDGVFTWQSQQRQSLDSPIVKQLVAHDDLTNNVHLFLRTQTGVRYTYFGRLGYLEHDPHKQKPVYFTWQLLEWPPPAGLLAGLAITPRQTPVAPTVRSAADTLIETPPPAIKGSKTGSGAKGGRTAALPDQDARNRSLGLAGENLVIQRERARLVEAGRPDLAERIVHTSIDEGDSAGYDIHSFESDGTDRHIEVKTTKGPATRGFFISPNELDFGDKHPDTYRLVRVYGYDEATNSGHFFTILGSVRDSLALKPSEYRARLLPNT